jgi:hypothetical protein
MTMTKCGCATTEPGQGHVVIRGHRSTRVGSTQPCDAGRLRAYTSLARSPFLTAIPFHSFSSNTYHFYAPLSSLIWLCLIRILELKAHEYPKYSPPSSVPLAANQSPSTDLATTSAHLSRPHPVHLAIRNPHPLHSQCRQALHLRSQRRVVQ